MGWVDDLRKIDEEKRRVAITEMHHNTGYDADRAARVLGIHAATNIPQEVVDGDLDRLEKELERGEFNYAAYTDKENGSPVFNSFAADNKYNYAVLERDRQHMTQFERSWNDIKLGFKSGRATTQLADLRNIDIAQGGATPEQKERMDELRQLLEGGDFGAEGHIMKLLVGTGRQLPIQAKLIYEAADEMMLGGAAGAVAGGVAMAGATAPIGGAGLIPGVLAGWSTGMAAGGYSGRTMAAFDLERGLAFDQYIQQGFDRKDALMFSNAVGSVNAALESFGAGALVKRVPGFRNIMRDRVGDAVAEIFTKPTIKHAVARGTIQYGEAVMTEVITEIMQDTSLMMAEEHMKTVARDVSGDTRPEMAMGTMPLFEQWKATAIHTLYGTLILSSGGPIMNYKADAKKAKDAAARQESWSRLKEGADNSETRKKSKNLWDNFIERMEKSGPVKDVRYSRQAWTEYWQSEKMDPDEVLRELGVDPEKLDVLDDDIVIPFTTFVDKIVPSNHFTGLQKDLRVGADEMTVRESQAWFAKQDEILKATRLEIDGTETRSVLRDMEEDLTGMLMGAGQFTREAARPQAYTLALQIYNIATQEGKDPKALTAKYLAGIRRQVPESLTPGDFDPQIDPLLNSIREGDFPKQREIYGDNIIDMMRGAGGILDDGGEMSSRDVQGLYPGLVSKTGKSIDAMAEIAFEAGYIKEQDETLFLEALDKQIMGSPVYSAQRAPDVALEEYLGKLEEAANFLEQENIDITNLSNKEVRDLMSGIQTLDQSSGQSLKDWTELVMAVTAASENLGAMPNTFDTMLAKAEALMPRVSANQDFKDVEFTDRVSETETVTYNAQERYNNAVKSRNILKQLAKCVNG